MLLKNKIDKKSKKKKKKRCRKKVQIFSFTEFWNLGIVTTWHMYDMEKQINPAF